MEITGNTFFFGWEVSLMSAIQSHFGTAGVKLAAFFTQFGEPMIIILITGLIYWGMDKNYGEYITANILAVSLTGAMIKNIAIRRRPYLDHESVQCLKPVEKGDIYDISLQGYSFPSLHAANSITLYTLVGRLMENKILKIACRLMPFLVGISRFVIGVHYPTDVLAGWLWGLTVMLIIDLLLKKLPDLHWIFVIILILTLPGFFFCESTDFYTSYGLMIGALTAFLFERKYVNFPPAKNYWIAFLRVIGGAVIFAGLSALLKLPFSGELLRSAGTVPFLIRTARYAVNSFIIFGVYPLCFRWVL